MNSTTNCWKVGRNLSCVVVPKFACEFTLVLFFQVCSVFVFITFLSLPSVTKGNANLQLKSWSCEDCEIYRETFKAKLSPKPDMLPSVLWQFISTKGQIESCVVCTDARELNAVCRVSGSTRSRVWSALYPSHYSLSRHQILRNSSSLIRTSNDTVMKCLKINC